MTSATATFASWSMVARRLAQLVFRWRCRARRVERDYRLVVWRDLSIDHAVHVNPYADIAVRDTLPLNLLHEYFPSTKLVVPCRGREIALDQVDAQEANLVQAARALEAYRAQPTAFHAFLVGVSYTQAGHAFYGQGRFDLALRSHLNAARWDCRPHEGEAAPASQRAVQAVHAGDARNIASCAVEVGELATAAREYVQAGDSYDHAGQALDAADCLLRAGLVWEAMASGGTRPVGLSTGTTSYNSTVCFAKAKSLYAAHGDYMSVSRSFIQERDSELRWTTSPVRRAMLHAMRAIWLYGESPLRAIRSLVAVWFAFGVAFLFAGFRGPAETINYDLTSMTTGAFPHDLGTALYFSAVTMATLGYGDYTPASGVARLLAGTEAFLGVAFASMLIVTVQRRYVGR